MLQLVVTRKLRYSFSAHYQCERTYRILGRFAAGGPRGALRDDAPRHLQQPVRRPLIARSQAMRYCLAYGLSLIPFDRSLAGFEIIHNVWER